jgi:ABC-type transport system involved in multi-copper enzyme maturation permease subunit
MGKLVKFELSKLPKSLGFIICTAVMVFLLFVNVLTFWGMGALMDELAEDMGELGGLLKYDMITSVLQAANNASFATIAGIVIAISVCSDFSQGTIKNIICRGYSRTKVYFSKLISITVMSVIMYLVAILFGWLFGMAFFGYSLPADNSWIGILAVQFVSAIAIAAFSFFIASVLRKTATSILFIIIVPTVLQVVLALIDVFAETTLSDYWITGVFALLSQSGVEIGRIISSLIVSLVYVAAFVTGGWLISKKYSY